MCGRYTIHADVEEVIRRFLLGRRRVRFDLRPRYNVAPTDVVAVVRKDGGERELVGMRWGLVPAWAKDPSIGSRMINARAESLADKPAFRDALAKRRCLIPADGFYEWKKEPGGRSPWYFTRKDGGPFALAGLWERWTSRGTGEELYTCAVITTEANELVRAVHDRMPVILRPEDEEAWLSGEGDVTRLLRPFPAEEMASHPVSRRVNKASVDDAGLIATAPLNESDEPKETLW